MSKITNYCLDDLESFVWGDLQEASDLIEAVRSDYIFAQDAGLTKEEFIDTVDRIKQNFDYSIADLMDAVIETVCNED